MRLPIHLRLAALAGLALVAAATARRPAEQAAPVWTIGAAPLLSIGNADDSDSLKEMLRASSAVRLSNGDIVVASGRLSRLQWYDRTGRFVRFVGRRGQGPGEFGTSLHLYAVPGDTVVVLGGDRRHQRFAPNGQFVRMDTLADQRRGQWLYDRTIVRRLDGTTDLRQVQRTLAQIPMTPRDTIRVARVDGSGNAWMRDPVNLQSYTIYNRDGRRIGTATVPPRFEIFQILDSLVLGRWRDDDDIEFIQVRALRRVTGAIGPAPATTRAMYDQDAELRLHARALAPLRAMMRNLLTAQEAYYADHKRYAPSMEALLRMWQAPEPRDGRIVLFSAQANSYGMVAEHPATRAVCVALLDGDDPPGPWDVCG